MSNFNLRQTALKSSDFNSINNKYEEDIFTSTQTSYFQTKKSAPPPPPPKPTYKAANYESSSLNRIKKEDHSFSRLKKKDEFSSLNRLDQNRRREESSAVLATSLRSQNKHKMEPSKEFGEFSTLLAPKLLGAKSNENITTTTTTKTMTEETREEEIRTKKLNKNNNDNNYLYSTTITKPVKTKSPEASFLLSEVTRAASPFKLNQEENKYGNTEVSLKYGNNETFKSESSYKYEKTHKYGNTDTSKQNKSESLKLGNTDHQKYGKSESSFEAKIKAASQNILGTKRDEVKSSSSPDPLFGSSNGSKESRHVPIRKVSNEKDESYRTGGVTKSSYSSSYSSKDGQQTSFSSVQSHSYSTFGDGKQFICNTKRFYELIIEEPKQHLNT